MALARGSRIGSYVVESLIGEGGMGEVYRARDTSLDRDVAIKRLPDALANDPERLARFEREARTLASLNHPNVAQIYAVESGSIIMELVPGQTLKGPLPLPTALDYAAQIASALDAAHERGIVHRDLKPGNVIVTPDGIVKVLDFGLAARESQGSDADPNRSPTMTAMSQQGMILGTAAYMAPEQASGKPVDKRADIFAFGVVLWEMLTGRRMFEGETISHVLAAVLTKEPDLSAVPSAVRPLLARCLEKDPKKRLRDIGDAMALVVTEPRDAGVPSPARGRAVLVSGWIVAAVAMAVALVAWPRSRPHLESDAPVVRYGIPRALDLYNFNATAFGLSPDGSQLAFHNPAEDGRYGLFVRSIVTGETRELSSAGANRFFGPARESIVWAPDGGRLVRGTPSLAQLVDVRSGIFKTLCQCRFMGGTWSRDNVLLLGSIDAPPAIVRVNLSDGTVVALTQPAAGEQDRSPVFLPDGKRFVFTRVTGDGTAAMVASLDGGTPTALGAFSPRAIVDVNGAAYLLSVDDGGVVARRFDLTSATTTGQPVTLVPGAVAASAGSNGILVTSDRGSRLRTVPTWFDRKGQSLGPAGPAGYFESVALSDDGTRLAMSESASGVGAAQNDIWLYDIVKKVKTRLTFSPANDSTAAWAPDGRTVYYTSRRDKQFQIFRKNADGTGDESPMFDDGSDAYTNDVSADGRWVLYSVRQSDGAGDLFVRPLVNGVAGKPGLYVGGPRKQNQAQFSPDGRYVVYGDDRSGTFEIYVQPFPDPSKGKWMVSQGGGTEPRWGRDGKELFYFSGQTLVAVPVTLTPTFSMGTPVKLFDAPIIAGYTNESDIWQVAPDGKRFLLLPPDGPQTGPPLQVLVNWPAMLKQ